MIVNYIAFIRVLFCHIHTHSAATLCCVDRHSANKMRQRCKTNQLYINKESFLRLSVIIKTCNTNDLPTEHKKIKNRNCRSFYSPQHIR